MTNSKTKAVRQNWLNDKSLRCSSSVKDHYLVLNDEKQKNKARILEAAGRATTWVIVSEHEKLK